MEYFRSRAGFDTSPVPYRGASAMVADLIAGHVKVSFGSTAGLLPLAKAGKLRALAVSTAERSPLAPDIPTIAESGYPGFEVTTDFVLMAPGGTPDDIVDLLQREVHQAIDTPEFRDRFAKQDIWIVGSTTAQTAARIAAGNQVWSNVIKQVGMKAE
jgi:tripartite-type tricarboxylate transporter receptor subunit TctC